MLFGVVCGMFMNIEGMNQFIILNVLALVLMFNFDLFRDTLYLNVIVCFIALLPNSYPAVFSLCAVNKSSVVNNSIIQIMVIKYQVL